MTRAEQETIFRYAADEDVVSIFMAYPSTARKLERAGHVPHKVSRQGGRPIGWFYKVPLREFRWRVGRAQAAPHERGAALGAGGGVAQGASDGGVMRALEARIARVSLTGDESFARKNLDPPWGYRVGADQSYRSEDLGGAA